MTSPEAEVWNASCRRFRFADREGPLLERKTVPARDFHRHLPRDAAQDTKIRGPRHQIAARVVTIQALQDAPSVTKPSSSTIQASSAPASFACWRARD